MSSVAISGNASGAGVFTIAAPNSASSFTATLPAATTTLVGTDATQTLTNKTLTSPTLTTPTIDSASVPTVSGTAPLYMARAWVNFNGTSTVAIRASGNVTSITDNGTGDYTVNFTTAMSDVNYTPVCFGNRASAGAAPRIPLIRTDGTLPTTSALRVEMVDTSSTGTSDQAYINIAIFR
jgi:hypothetical protein